MKNRIIGFDLARAWAILGMYIVNFNIVFGNYSDPSPLGRFLSLFSGNSSSTFVVLAGMGVSLLTFRPEASPAERRDLRRVVLRRSWFLFGLGLLLYLWWPADILHFYGGYMHIAALLLLVPQRWLLWAAAAAVIGFHLLLAVVPYDHGWDFETLQYMDFWTLSGFLRNTFYNGWNPIFPWAAFFFFGMWLGRLNWQDASLQKRFLWCGGLAYALVQSVIWAVGQSGLSDDTKFYFTADYLPPFLPFMLSTGSFSVVVVAVCTMLGTRFAALPVLEKLVATGRMTLSHYILHLTLGMLALAALSGKGYAPALAIVGGLPPVAILAFSVGWFAASVAFSWLWGRWFKNGPFETLMRKLAG